MLDELTLSLQIEVFLPPNQRGSGTLELYNLNYNIAIVSVKNFHAVCAEDIFCRVVQNPSEKSSSYRPWHFTWTIDGLTWWSEA